MVSINDSISGYLVLFTILSIGTAIGLPRQIAALSAGYFFSLTIGFTLALTATTLGCVLTYHLSQFGLYQFVHRKFPTKSAAVENFLSESTFSKALLIRLLPLGSNFITNIVAGATQAPRLSFFTGSCLGFIPQMLLFSAIGSGIAISAADQKKLSLTLAFAAIVIGVYLYLSHKKRAH